MPLPPANQLVISGLKVQDGYRCALDRCDGFGDRLSINQRMVQNHRARVHGVQRCKSMVGIDPVHLQTFFQERRYMRLFVVGPVRPNIPPPVMPDPANEAVLPTAGVLETLQAFKHTQKTWTDAFKKIPIQEIYTDRTPWMSRTGFTQHLRGRNKDELLQAVCLPGRKLLATSTNPTRMDGSDIEGEDTNAEPLLKVVTKACRSLLTKSSSMASTRGEKSRLSHLDARILNSLEKDRTQSKPFRRPEHEATLKRYSEEWERLLCYVIRLTAGNFLEELVKLKPGQEDAFDSIRHWARATLDGQDDGLPVPTIRGRTAPWMETMEEAILKGSMSLIRQSIVEDSYQSPMLSFLAARALKRDGSWKTPRQTSSMLSGFTHIIQLLLYLEAQHEADLEMAAGRNDSFHGLLKQSCRKWLVNSQPTPSAEILSWRLYASEVNATTVPPGWTSWSEDGLTITHLDVSLSMHEWQALVRKVLGQAAGLFQSLVLDQADCPRPRAHHLQDVPEQTRPGFSFVQDPRNGLKFHREWLINRVTRTPALRLRLADVREGRLIWRSLDVARYLGQVGDFLERMLLLIHLTGGLPARAPEIIGLRHCNEERNRSIMVHDGSVMILTSYHKMQYAVGSRLIARFLPEAVGDLLVEYLAVVQPFARHLQMQTGQGSSPSHLFATGDRPWDKQRLTKVMRRETAALTGEGGLTVSAWRHMAIAIDRRFLRGIGAKTYPGSTENEEEDLVNDIQASHSSLAGGIHYGSEAGSGRMFTVTVLAQFRDLSRQWHELLGLGGVEHEAWKQRIQSDPASAMRIPVVPKRGRADSLVLRGGARACQGLAPRRTWTESEVREGMRAIHGPQAQPRSDGQWEALTEMGRGQAQLLVVLPTGAGKSLLFQLGSVLPEAGVTVVILPLVVLKQDLLGQCGRLGLSHTVWHGGMEVDSTCAPLLLASVEDAMQKKFLGYLRSLRQRDQLDRVVLDEAQMVLTESHYRDSLRAVAEVRRTTVPFVALTATLPPAQEAALSEALFMDRPRVIRRSANRPELGYRVLTMAGVQSLMPEGERLPDDFLEAACWFIQSGLRVRIEADERMICYCRSKAQVERLAKLLGCQVYHAGISDRAAVYGNWLEGRHQTIVGTSAMGAGVDFPRVRVVVHVGSPRNAMAYSQEAGRAGRDGQSAQCMVLLPHAMAPDDGERHDLDQAAMRDFLSTQGCRREVLTSYLDGQGGRRCSGEDPLRQCDKCMDRQLDQTGDRSGSNLEAGDRLAREARRRLEAERGRYLERLKRWTGRCLNCWVDQPDGDWNHVSCEKNRTAEWNYQKMRKHLQLSRGIGCFGCVNPEWACDRQGAPGNCRWGDVVLRVAYGLHRAKGKIDWATSSDCTITPAVEVDSSGGRGGSHANKGSMSNRKISSHHVRALTHEKELLISVL